MAKVFKTLDEQVEILQSKGLIINDIPETKDILLRENYFFISGYRMLFMESQENKKFLPGTTFDELYSMFQFDRHVRNILFKNLLIIENNIKSIMAFHLSSRYGIREDEYLNPKNFVLDRKRKKQVDDLLRKMKRQIRINGGQHQATMHYSEKYGYVPMWIAVKVLSFGIVSELFQILKPDDQETVANDFNLAKETLEIYLPVLANFRNLCAHEDILFEHKAQRNIPDTKYHNLLKIPQVNDEYIYADFKYTTGVFSSNSLEQIIEKGGFNFSKDENGNAVAGSDETSTIKQYLAQMDTDVNSVTYGTVKVNLGLMGLLQKLMDKYTFKDVADSWLKVCYFKVTLGSK